MDQATAAPPHVIIFPLPAQGHVNSMLKLSQLLCLAGVHVTFLISRNSHDCLLRYTNVHNRFNSYPGFRFNTLPDNLYEGDVSTGDGIMMVFDSLLQVAKPFLKELLVTAAGSNYKRMEDTWPPATCLIADGILTFTIDVAEGTGIPVILFRTISACAFWAYFCIPQLIGAGELPFKGDDDMDEPLENVSSMEGFLRRRDLPSFCRVTDINNRVFKALLEQTLATTRAHGLILNTFEDLEGPILSRIRRKCPNLYTIGPLPSHLKTRLKANTTFSNSLREEDRSCISWLDQQPLKSVIYVSFGSITTLTREELIEFWYGLINSGQRFLWVIRPDSISGQLDEYQRIPQELEEHTKERGYMVDWAPQEEVLAHRAVGGFLTHSGWNSTLESIVEGVPMVCWPFFADQQVNSRFIEAVWNLGLDMKDTCDRVIVEKMVKGVMEDRRAEFVRSAHQMAEMARKSVSEGGSSYCDLNRLIEDIRLMGAQPHST